MTSVCPAQERAYMLLKNQFPLKNGNSLQAKIIYRNLSEVVEKISRDPASIDSANPKGLTALFVATILGKQELVQYLLKKGANPLARDAHEWTPLHFAEILGHLSIKNLLIKAALKIQDAIIPRLTFLKEVLNPVFPSPKDPVATLRQGEKYIPLTAEQFKSLTGAQFFNSVYANPENLMRYWDLVNPKKLNPDSLARKIEGLTLFRECELNPPKLYMGKDLKVYAKEDIAMGKVVGFYGGEIDFELTEKFYRVSETNGEKFRNLMGMIPDDGNPNCILQEIEVEGIPVHLIITTKKIQSGGSFSMDFGPGHVWKNEYHPLPQSTFKFYKENPPGKLLKKLEVSFRSKQKRMETDSLLSDIGYLISTPFAMIELILKGCFSVSEMRKVSSFALQFMNLTSTQKLAFEEILSGLEFILNEVLPMHKGGQDMKIKRDILFFIQNRPLNSVLRFMELLKSELGVVCDDGDRKYFFESMHEQADLDEILEEWHLGLRPPISAELALLAMNEERRDLMIPILQQTIQIRFPEKLDELYQILAGLNLRLWVELEGEQTDKVVRMLARLTPQARKQLYQQHAPHFKARYPILAKTFDQLFHVNGEALSPSLSCGEFTESRTVAMSAVVGNEQVAVAIPRLVERVATL